MTTSDKTDDIAEKSSSGKRSPGRPRKVLTPEEEARRKARENAPSSRNGRPRKRPDTLLEKTTATSKAFIQKQHIALLKQQKIGKTPLEVMLANMRYHDDEVQRLMRLMMEQAQSGDMAAAEQTMFRCMGHRQNSQRCAVDAAPYVHPKLASIETNVNIAVHEQQLLELISDDDNIIDITPEEIDGDVS